jgi:D-3-phosphoglycerate dehydrogenase
MQKKLCLFSAPRQFIDKSVFKNKKINFYFKEIWKKSEIKKKNLKIYSWIVNPGQNFKIDEKILKFYPNLKYIITPSTGSNHINIQDCKKRKIKVFSLLNNREELSNIKASSEFTFLLLLNSLRRLDIAINEIDKIRWRQNENLMRGNELAQKKIGIIGLGRIGSNLAKWIKAFGANVEYYDPVKKKNKYKKRTIAKIFSNSDIVCLCCTLNDKTKNLIDISYLKLLKKKAILVNTSRGEVINETDLIKFLNKRKDIFFTSDVLSGEVNGSNMKSKLIQMHKKRRILLTPHIAGASVESQSKAADIAVKILLKNLNEKN